MRVICIEDGKCDDPNFPTPKKGTIYHILSLEKPDENNVNKGDWYQLIELPGKHWYGLFLPVEYDDELEKEIKLQLHEK